MTTRSAKELSFSERIRLVTISGTMQQLLGFSAMTGGAENEAGSIAGLIDRVDELVRRLDADIPFLRQCLSRVAGEVSIDYDDPFVVAHVTNGDLAYIRGLAAEEGGLLGALDRRLEGLTATAGSWRASVLGEVATDDTGELACHAAAGMAAAHMLINPFTGMLSLSTVSASCH